MKSNEIRIGNWVNQLERHCKITAIASRRFHLKSEFSKIKCSHDLVNPIPITEEWLLKFGFSILTNEAFFNGLNLSNTEWGDAIGNTGFGWFYDLIREDGMLAMHIRHVHQLQNLYFALTGEELTIK